MCYPEGFRGDSLLTHTIIYYWLRIKCIENILIVSSVLVSFMKCLDRRRLVSCM